MMMVTMMMILMLKKVSNTIFSIKSLFDLFFHVTRDTFEIIRHVLGSKQCYKTRPGPARLWSDR